MVIETAAIILSIFPLKKNIFDITKYPFLIQDARLNGHLAYY
jgi:hypothetical protein